MLSSCVPVSRARARLCPDWLPEANCSDLVIVRASEQVRPSFVSYVVNSVAQHHISSHTVGAVQQHFNVGSARTVRFMLPPLFEQDRIVGLLDAIRDKIELNRHMAEALEETVRALFKSWFVDFDPVHANVKGGSTKLPVDIASLFPDTFEADGVPATWSVRSVRDVCRSIFSGGTPATANSAFWDGPLPWLSSGETRTHFIIETEKKITTAAVEGSSTRLAKLGSTVIASAGQGQTRGQTSMLLLDTYINQSIIALEAEQDSCSSLFLYFDLARRYAEFRGISDGQSSRGSLTTKLLASLRTILPSRTVIEAFDSVAEPVVDRIDTILRQSKALAETRDVLLPKLISGELRVADAEKKVTAA
jgi:type I restriction enzyme S subunit